MANLRIVSCRCLNESCSLLSYVPSFFPNGTSSKSKKRKSVTISAPIPCNTAFPSDNPAMSKLSMPNMDTDTRSDTPSKSTGSTASEISDSESNSFDSEPNTPKRQSLCSQGEGVLSEGANESTSETTNDESVQANGQEHQDSVLLLTIEKRRKLYQQHQRKPIMHLQIETMRISPYQTPKTKLHQSQILEDLALPRKIKERLIKIHRDAAKM